MFYRHCWRGALAAVLFIASPGYASAGTDSDSSELQERVAACSACHASEGIQLDEGYVPRIHGKPAGYLYNQLINYQTYRRRDANMNVVVAHLTHSYLFEIAEYFANQHPPYPAAAPEPSEALAKRGEQLVHEGDAEAGLPACASCHGERLTGVQPNTPALIGLPRQYIMGQLGAWKEGVRSAVAPDCMADIVEKLDGRDLVAIASWLAARPVTDNSRAVAQPLTDLPMECGSVPAPE